MNMTNHLANFSKAIWTNRNFQDVAEENLPAVEFHGTLPGRSFASGDLAGVKAAVWKSVVARRKTAALAGFLSLLTGCGIPQLRHPEPGPMLPTTFAQATNQVDPDGSPPVPTPPPVPIPGSGEYEPKPDDAEIKPDKAPSNPDGKKTSDAGDRQTDIRLTSFFVPEAMAPEAEFDRFDAEFGNVNYVASDPEEDTSKPDPKAAGSEDVMAHPDPKAGGIYGEMTGPGSDAATSVDEMTDPDADACWPDNSSFVSWYEFFNDPTLAGLVNQALAGNQELKILTEEIFIARNEVQARRGEYLPFVRLGGCSFLEKSSRFTRDGAVEEELEVAPDKAFPEPLPDFLIAADVSWEVDIWRKLRNARDAAAFRFLASQDGQTYIVTRMIAEVAENYYELLALDNQLKTLDRTIEIQEQSLKVADALKNAGQGTELGVQRFLAEVRKNQSEKLVIQQEIIEVENRINFLLGRYPQAVERPPVEFIDLALPSLKVGAPAQILQNRPDIRQAERELAAAGLDIQVAKARFYPSLDITAGLGYQAFNPRYLFRTPEALIYDVAGELIAPLINKQAIKADYKTANAKQLQAVYHYQRTVLNAYTEVINRMTKVENFGKSIEVKKRQLAALEASVEVADRLFQGAQLEYVELLLAQREMMEARMILIQTKQQQLSAVINTYQALGGGGLTTGVAPFGHCPDN